MSLPTKWYRATCKEVAYAILPPEPFRRHVRVLVVENEVTEIGLVDCQAELDEWLSDVNKLDQDAQLPLCPADIIIPMVVQADQALVGRCRNGLSEVSIIVEYLD